MTDYFFLTSKTATGTTAVQVLNNILDAVYVGANATLLSEGTPIVGTSDDNATIDGVVHGVDSGLYFSGSGNTIDVNGMSSGVTNGIKIDGDGNSIDIGPAGVVEGDYRGIFLLGQSDSVTNEGTVKGAYGIHAETGGVSVVNSGEIVASDVGIQIYGSPGDTNDIVNTGEILMSTKFGFAIEAGDNGTGPDDTVTNRGYILGDVAVGGGNDIVDSRHGTVDGTIYGGSGDDILIGSLTDDNILNGGSGKDIMTGGSADDIYIVDDKGDRTIERANGGTDTVIVSVSYTLGKQLENLTLNPPSANDIHATGNKLDNIILGNSYDSTLDGGAGADHLSGGGGKDIFLFRKINDIAGDVITDFTHATDKIDLHIIDADSHTSGNQAFHWLGNGDFTHHAGELHRSLIGARTVVSGDTDGNGVADFTLTLSGHDPLSATDFML